MKDNNEVLLFGAGVHAVKLMETVSEMGLNFVGFISTEPPGTMVNGFPVLGYLDLFNRDKELQEKSFHISIGENSIRHAIYNSLDSGHNNMISLIAKSSSISNSAIIGKGTHIGKSVIIQNNTRIGICCLIDTRALIEHDVIIGDFVTVSPGAVVCGEVTIGRGAIIGANSTVIEKVHIGENSLIGAGSVVTKDVEPNVIAVGNPLRIIKKRKFEDRYLKR
jgi:sugar O-acyltransferase (sialic acid O-acetyltransferase NeuD family)